MFLFVDFEGFNVFKDQKLYDQEYLKTKQRNMESFFQSFEKMSRSNEDLAMFIGHHKKALDSLDASQSNLKRNSNKRSKANERDTKAECEKENSQTLTLGDKNEEEKFDQFKTFIIQHSSNKEINIKEFDRLSKDGIEVNRINSKYLNN